MGIATKAFDILDQFVETHLQDAAAENALIDAYWEWFDALKDRVGTSSNFTGLSEYLFFRYILRSIESRTGASFRVEKHTKDTAIFRSPQFLLTHDINVGQFVDITHQKTDIAILSPLDNGRYRLLAAFELKVYVTDRHILNDLLKRLGYLGQHTNALLFPVFFLPRPQYDSEMAKFCGAYPGRAFLISKIAHRYGIGIKQAIDKILS